MSREGQQTTKGPKRHHYVPKFYLRGFADRKRRVRVYSRANRKDVYITSVNNAAVESGLYTALDESGREIQDVEPALSRAESSAKLALDRLASGPFPPSEADREDISLHLALQLLRTPDHRRQFEFIADYSAKVLLKDMSVKDIQERIGQRASDVALNPEDIQKFISDTDGYKVTPPRNEYLQIMLTNAGTLGPVIAQRSWILLNSRHQGFVTGDHPLVWHGRPQGLSEFEGLGLGNALEVYFPLNRSKALAMAPPTSLRETSMDATSDNVLFVNWLISQFSYKWIYQHPEDEELSDIIPGEPRAMLEINGEPVFDS